MRKLLIFIGLFVSFALMGQGMNVMRTTHRVAASGGELTVVDIIGWTGEGGSSIASTDQVNVFRDTANISGSIDSLFFYTQGNTAGDSIELAIYADDSNYPGALLGKIARVLSPLAVVNEWHGYPLESSVSITSGNVYWIGYHATSTGVFYRTGNATRQRLTLAWANALPNPFTGGGAAGTNRYSMYGKVKN